MGHLVAADGTDSHAENANLFLLLIITWLLDIPPALQQGFYSTSLLPLLTQTVVERYARLPGVTQLFDLHAFQSHGVRCLPHAQKL